MNGGTFSLDLQAKFQFLITLLHGSLITSGLTYTVSSTAQVSLKTSKVLKNISSKNLISGDVSLTVLLLKTILFLSRINLLLTFSKRSLLSKISDRTK